MRRDVVRGLLLAVIVFQCGEASAQSRSSRVTPDAARLQVLNAQLQETLRAPDAATRGLGVATERRELLLALMGDAPSDVLRLALPASVRNSLAPTLQALIEEHVELSGTLEVAYEDHRTFGRLRHTLDTGTGRYGLHFATEPAAWTDGARVRVRGVRVQAELALGADSASITFASTAPTLMATASGVQRTVMILVNFRNAPLQPYSAAQAHQMVFGTTDGYFREVSAGAASLTGDVFGWFTINMDSTSCDAATLATLAEDAARRAGVDLSQYDRKVYGFPQNACTWWGRGSVGGSPSQAWINGELALDVVGHELGHNLGLYHSNSLDCGALPIGSTCTAEEYGDTIDIMGATRGHYNAFQKERIGWLAPSQILTVTDTGTYSIEPFETLTGGVKALKILKSIDATTGGRTFYYVELRQGIGYDAFMSGWANVMNGVSIHTGSEAGASYLLDMTPETTTWYDPALVTGRTFSDSTAGISVTTLAASASGATVSVNMPSAPSCVRANPTVSLSPGLPSAVSPGTTIAYVMTVANNDSAACPAATFAFAPTVPGGWTGTFDVTSASIAPGTSTSATFRVTSSSSAPGGTYSVSARAADAANASHAGAGSASYLVAVAPTGPTGVQVSTNSSSYSRSNTVTATAVVMAGASPAAGVSVTFTFLKPNGTSVTSTTTTDARGYASAQLRLRSKDPVGAYSVTARSGTVSGSASFSVR